MSSVCLAWLMSPISLNTLNALISLNISSIHLGAQASSQAPLFSFLSFPLTSSAFANLGGLCLYNIPWFWLLLPLPQSSAWSRLPSSGWTIATASRLTSFFLLYALQTTARLRLFVLFCLNIFLKYKICTNIEQLAQSPQYDLPVLPVPLISLLATVLPACHPHNLCADF